MSTGLLITNLGNDAIVADLAGGTNLVLTHVAFGDANGVPYAPNPAQTVLVNERYRATISSIAVVPGALVVECQIPADTPDASARPSHGFLIAEAGLYSSAGTLIGVARMGNGLKPSPASGQAAIATFQFKLACQNPSAITVVIDPVAQIHVGRHVRPFWMAVEDVLNAPPGAPVTGATYIIGTAPTGAWAGFANRMAQWVGVWVLATAPTGHVVCDTSQPVNNADRFIRFDGAAWVSAAASQTAHGFARLATQVEEDAGTSDSVAMTPAGVRRQRPPGAGLQWFTASGTFTVPANVNKVRTICRGGGGGGGHANGSTAAAGGGGGGGYVEGVFAVTPGQILDVTVGAGGVGGAAAAANGGNGGSTLVAIQGGATLLTAFGGQGGFGAASNTTASGGQGSTWSAGQIGARGGNGQGGIAIGAQRLAGSGGQGALGGGPGAPQHYSVAQNGVAHGGGGSGGYNTGAGGDGAAGSVLIEF